MTGIRHRARSREERSDRGGENRLRPGRRDLEQLGHRLPHQRGAPTPTSCRRWADHEPPHPGWAVGARRLGRLRGLRHPRFDTLMAKLIVWERIRCRHRQDGAGWAVPCGRGRTTIPSPASCATRLLAGRLSTSFMERLMSADRPEAAGRRRTVALVAAALTAYEQAGKRAPLPPTAGLSPWTQAGRPSRRPR